MYRITYPLITCDGARDFATEGEAQAFAESMRAVVGRATVQKIKPLISIDRPSNSRST